jgi:hypothetical protein
MADTLTPALYAAVRSVSRYAHGLCDQDIDAIYLAMNAARTNDTEALQKGGIALAEQVLTLVDQHREHPFRSIDWLGDQLSDLLAARTIDDAPDARPDVVAKMVREYWPGGDNLPTAKSSSLEVAKRIIAALSSQPGGSCDGN